MRRWCMAGCCGVQGKSVDLGGRRIIKKKRGLQGREVGRRGGEGGCVGEGLDAGDGHAEVDVAGGAGAGFGDAEEVRWKGD